MTSSEFPVVTCIVLNWNGWRDTIHCIHSLEKSDYPQLEVLVVDNGSTDDSVEQIRGAFPQLRIICSEKNLGFGAGNNLAIQQALEDGAEYIWLLNNDTIVYPATLREMVITAQQDSAVGAVGSVLRYMHAPGEVQAWGGGKINLWTGYVTHFTEPVSLETLDYLTAASVLLRAQVMRMVGTFDPAYFMYWEDTDLGFRIRSAGWKFSVAEQAVLLHKENGSSKAKSANFDRMLTSSGVTFFRRYAPVPALTLFVFVGGRALKRLASGNLAGFKAILQGYWKR